MLLKARDEGVAVAEADALGRGAPYRDDEEAMYRRGSGLSEKEEYGQVNDLVDGRTLSVVYNRRERVILGFIRIHRAHYVRRLALYSLMPCFDVEAV